MFKNKLSILVIIRWIFPGLNEDSVSGWPEIDWDCSAANVGLPKFAVRAFVFILFSIIGLCFTAQAAGAAPNEIATYQIQTNAVTNQIASNYSEAELQTAARGVLYKLVLLAALVILGGLVVAGLAIYGAYKAFGVKGVIAAAIVIIIIFFLVGAVIMETY